MVRLLGLLPIEAELFETIVQGIFGNQVINNEKIVFYKWHLPKLILECK